MKIRIEPIEEPAEEEIVIRCHSLSDEIARIQHAVSSVTAEKQSLVLYKEETEYYIALEDILFFQTESSGIQAHTRNDVYYVKFRLYELEELLPAYFLRISKSAIINVKQIYSLSKSSFSTTSEAAFSGTHKKVFVSRFYMKLLKEKLMEMRMR